MGVVISDEFFIYLCFFPSNVHSTEIAMTLFILLLMTWMRYINDLGPRCGRADPRFICLPFLILYNNSYMVFWTSIKRKHKKNNSSLFSCWWDVSDWVICREKRVKRYSPNVRNMVTKECIYRNILVCHQFSFCRYSLRLICGELWKWTTRKRRYCFLASLCLLSTF